MKVLDHDMNEIELHEEEEDEGFEGQQHLENEYVEDRSFETEGYSLSEAEEGEPLFDAVEEPSDDLIQEDAEEVDLFADLNLDE